VEAYELCREFRVLPHAGGLLDQDPDWVRCLEIARQVRQEAKGQSFVGDGELDRLDEYD